MIEHIKALKKLIECMKTMQFITSILRMSILTDSEKVYLIKEAVLNLSEKIRDIDHE